MKHLTKKTVLKPKTIILLLWAIVTVSIFSAGCHWGPFDTGGKYPHKADLIRKDFSNWDKWYNPYHEKIWSWEVLGNVCIDPNDPEKLNTTSGQGVIYNHGKETADLVSKKEFKDVMAHIEFLVPRNSNSGVYFMGRYEIQIYSSWGVEEPKHSDCGGIYQRWDPNRQPKGFQGHPPRVNACKRPGQWQSFDVIFHAPRFDEDGNKINNAKFVKVLLNGTLIHEDVELTGPTRSGFAGEVPRGPIRLQGDHGPVAYRNIWIIPLADDCQGFGKKDGLSG